MNVSKGELINSARDLINHEINDEAAKIEKEAEDAVKKEVNDVEKDAEKEVKT